MVLHPKVLFFRNPPQVNSPAFSWTLLHSIHTFGSIDEQKGSLDIFLIRGQCILDMNKMVEFEKWQESQVEKAKNDVSLHPEEPEYLCVTLFIAHRHKPNETR